MNNWIAHCKEYHSKHPDLSWSQVLVKAKPSYKKNQKGGYLDPSYLTVKAMLKVPKAIKGFAGMVGKEVLNEVERKQEDAKNISLIHNKVF
jgi:hypothetical protein